MFNQKKSSKRSAFSPINLFKIISTAGFVFINYEIVIFLIGVYTSFLMISGTRNRSFEKELAKIAYYIELISMIWASTMIADRAYRPFLTAARSSIPPQLTGDYCIDPNLLGNENQLNIYASSNHFFTEFMCNQCDGGNFYYDTHSVLGFKIATLRDTFDFENANFFQLESIKLSEPQATQVLKTIRHINKRIEAGEIDYEITQFNCIDYTQHIYNATGNGQPMAALLGTNKLAGIPGVYAQLKYASSENNTLWNLFSILINNPAPISKAEKSVPCVDRNGKIITQFGLFCKRTPSNIQIPDGYISDFLPNAESYAGAQKFVFFK
jgi:hypothetical protein